MFRRLLIVMLLLSSHFVISAQGIDKPKYRIETYRLSNFLGNIDIELFPVIAPLHVAMFDSLVSVQFFDSTAFHRVVPGFVIQGGDPNSISGPISTWGQGQPWQPTVPAEFNAVRHLRGIIGAARDSDPNSATSQFYICVGSPTYLDGNYTVYGRVTAGMDIVDSIVNSPRDANDVPLQKISMFITSTGTNPSVPAAPALSSPADGTTNVLNTTAFTWLASDSAVLYTIQFATDSLFSNVVYADTVGGLTASFPTIEGMTLYYWRVLANNGGHESVWSSVRSFTSATGRADVIYPPDSSMGIPVNLNFIWTSVPGATSYLLQVSDDPVFIGANIIYSQAGIIDTTHVVTGLLPNTVYYWRIQSANGTQNGMYSRKFYFVTGTGTSVNEIQNLKGINISNTWPNPTGDFVNLQISSAESQELDLKVNDISGRVVKSQKQKLTPGENNIRIVVDQLTAGSYIIEFRNGSEAVFRRFIRK